MRILVTGRDGQVARSLADLAGSYDMHFAARPELDLADADSIEATINAITPDVIISAAAYTQVDQAEDEPELAMEVNGVAPGVIGSAAKRIGAKVLHLSTDYVFDGNGVAPWQESDSTGPQGTYGKTKLAGEQALAASGAQHTILRSAWVYSPYGKNFVKTMLMLAGKGNPIKVVDDQIGNPTAAADIANGLLHVIDHWGGAPHTGVNTTFHFAGNRSMSWAEFAKAIMEESAAIGGPSVEVGAISSAEYPTKAVRPANSRLDSSRFGNTFGYTAPDWRASLKSTIQRLLDDC